MTKLTTGAALAALLIVAEAAASQAGAVTLYRGSSGASGVTHMAAAGVNIYRGPKPVEDELAGGEAAYRAPDSEIIVVECRRRPDRYLRTQGFYSGHPGDSRRFTQGFYSGPVDLPRSSVKIVRIKRK
jgi:hypothetical protein